MGIVVYIVDGMICTMNDMMCVMSDILCMLNALVYIMIYAM